MKPSYFLPLAVLLALGCSPDVQTVDPEDQIKVLSNEAEGPRDLMPLTTGSAWTYEVNQVTRTAEGSGSGSAETTLKVTGKQGEKATIAIMSNDKQSATVQFVEVANGLNQASIKPANEAARTFSPALPVYRWPMEVNETVEWEGTGAVPTGGTGKFKSTMTYKGESEVDTPAGRMKAHRFDTSQTHGTGDNQVTSNQSVWFVPKIGIVRSVEIIATSTAAREAEMKLKSYTVK